MCEHVLLLATIRSAVPLSKLIAGAWVKIPHMFAFKYTLVTFPSVWVQKLQDFQTYWLLSSLFFLERKGGNVCTDSSQTRCGRGGCIQMCLCVRVCMYSVSVCACMCCFSHLMLWCFSMAEKVIQRNPCSSVRWKTISLCCECSVDKLKWSYFLSSRWKCKLVTLHQW